MLHLTHANANVHQSMTILLLRDPWTFVSIVGISMIAVVQWITTHINPIVATISLLLGVVLLVLGIIEKWQIVKAKWKIKIPRKK